MGDPRGRGNTMSNHIYHLYNATGEDYPDPGDMYVCGALCGPGDVWYKFIPWYLTNRQIPLFITYCASCVNHPSMMIHELAQVTL